MSRTKINESINRLMCAALRSGEGRKAENAVESIIWYINTGRANMDFLKAFCNLTNCRAKNLVQKILPVWGCTDDVIRVTKRYLKAK